MNDESKNNQYGISDDLWNKVSPLIPERHRIAHQYYQRQEGGGRHRLEPRRVFAAILVVLRNRIGWHRLPSEFGSPSSINRYFQEWEKAGVFSRIWRKGLAEHPEMAGIAWEWQPDEERERIHAASAREWHRNRLASHRDWRPVVVRRTRNSPVPPFKD